MQFDRGLKSKRTGLFAGLLALGVVLFTASVIAQETTASRDGVILTLNGPVTPASAQYLSREIALASDAKKELIIIEIDTPGGLVTSMKTIIKSILASDTPVATFVSPQGARSASAGLYIMYSAHFSAMAPSTNTGAATPIEIGGGSPSDENPFEDAPTAPGEESEGNQPADEVGADGAAEESQEDAQPETSPLSNDDALRAKIINDSVAYIRALAEERGRNADWAESAVRDAVSITSREALELGVIDFVADDIDDLLQQIDGKGVRTASGEKLVTTQNLVLARVEPTLIEKILGFISDPNVAVILMSLGTTGIIIEMWNPGSIFPGAVGLTSLILGLYSFQVLPFNWLGLVLMGVGVIFITLEAYTPTFGLIGLAGMVLFGFGLFVVFPEGFRVSPSVIGSVLAIAGAFLGLILVAVVGSRSHGPLIGGDAIKRREGIVDDWDGKEGHVVVEGERWRARSDKVLKKGDKIRVVDVDGLVLVVKQAKASGLLGALVPSEA